MSRRRSTIISLALLLALTLAMFADVLFAGGTRVLGNQASDLFLQYYAWRDFGFSELAKGNLALWNPHIFSGAPYFGGMQGAQLYPPNWIFLILPLPVAINWSVALHVFAIGAFMFLWMQQRGLNAPSSFFAGATVMFCGAFFPHVFAGHLPQLCAMTWAPLIFCAIDALFENVRLRSLLLGMFAIAMQLLAGFPQYLFYTAIIAGLYSLLRLLSDWNWRRAVALLSIYPGAALLAAVQLLPAIQTTAETTRGLRLPFAFASMVAFPPENFLTVLAPSFFGEMAKYWGRWYLWETSLFIGVVALALVVYAVIRCERKTTLPAIIVILVSLLLSPRPLYTVVRFPLQLGAWIRSFSQYFEIHLPGVALSHFARCDRTRSPVSRERRIAGCTDHRYFCLWCRCSAAAGSWATQTASWSALMNSIRVSGQSYLFPQLYTNAEFIAQSQHCAALSLFTAADRVRFAGNDLGVCSTPTPKHCLA